MINSWEAAILTQSHSVTPKVTQNIDVLFLLVEIRATQNGMEQNRTVCWELG